MSAAVGDRVSVMPLFFCGECSACREGREQCCVKLGAVGYNWRWGGMGEYAVVADHQVARLPDEMTAEQGALVEPTAVALHAVTSAPVRAGDIVLVTGGGPIGQLVALCAMAAGAGAVYLSEPNPRRRRHAETLGLAGVLDPNDGDVVAPLREQFPAGSTSRSNAPGISTRSRRVSKRTAGSHSRPDRAAPEARTDRPTRLTSETCR